MLGVIEIGVSEVVQRPKAIYLAKLVTSDKVFFSADYISFSGNFNDV